MKGTNGDLPLIDVPVPHEQRIDAVVQWFSKIAEQDVPPKLRPPDLRGLAEAPGRVNLIGEHVDYNDGLVLPIAIDRSVLCGSGRTEDGIVSVHGLDVGDGFSLILDEPGQGVYGPPPLGQFEDYPMAVMWSIEQASHKLQGGWWALTGDVPQGAGLSSSAAFEVAFAGALRDSCQLTMSDVELAQLCQQAENEYVGVQCGIMDQFASALSRAGHALLIDCRTLAYKHVPLRLADHGLAIVIANSAVRRELITSAYNERRRECEEAAVRLRYLLGRPELSSLRDVEGHEIDGLEIAADDVVLRRARHVVSEIARVAEAVDALERDDFGRLGELMVESHLSLRDDYAVSSEQLDLLVGLATAQEYVLGARLTGAGFGGCTVNLVRADRVEDFARDVIAPYRERTGLPAVMYVTPACDGLRTWRL